jgi:hypothetical protein
VTISPLLRKASAGHEDEIPVPIRWFKRTQKG